MPSWKTPTTEQIEHAISLLARPEQRRYFFDKLQNPNWLQPLEQREFFKNPPAPIKDDDRGTIQFPPWPELQYLTRMADIPGAHEDVLRIALNIPATENIIVHDGLAEIANKLPAPMAAQLVPRAEQWLAGLYHGLLPTHLGALIKHLANNDQPEAARNLARVTLAISKKGTQDPQAHMEPWTYGQILKDALPSLTDSIGMDALSITTDLLEAAAPSYKPGGTPPTQDGSTIWHEYIEEDADLHSIRNLLVSATRNTAAQLARRQPQDARGVIAALEARPTIVFHRIAIEILRREREVLPDLVAAHLTNHDAFNNAGLRHEYRRLLHDAYPSLAATDQELILNWIENGPPTSLYAARVAATGQQPTPEDIARYKRLWQRQNLTPIATHLPPSWATIYKEIINELGQEEERRALVAFSGPTSPITKTELEKMTPEAIIDYLVSWSPTDELFGQSRAGIAIELTSMIAANPTKLDTVIDRCRTLHPTYLRNYFYGVREGNEKSHPPTWECVLDLAEWIVNQPSDTAPGGWPEPFGDDHGWSGPRSAIADLLNQALNNNVPAVYRDILWRIIRILAEDPDPTPEFEATYGPEMDAPLLAINTTRGKALESVIKCALMIHQAQPAATGFTVMPDVPAVLNQHLDRDPSVAVRTVYGRFFPWLVLLDHDWAQTKVDTIFGDERGKAAWEAYVTFCPAYDNAVELLGPYYERAVHDVQHDQRPEHRGNRPDPDEHLGYHLMTRYYRGQLPLHLGLVPSFFDRAPEGVRAHSVECIGRILYSSRETASMEIRERVVNLWAARRQAALAAPDEHRAELAAFGWWFAAGKLDTVWELNQLRDVLRINHGIALDHAVIERLAKLAPEHPELAVECLGEFVATERQYWTILGNEKYVWAILAHALQDDGARPAATALVHHLGEIGYTKFRSLLQQT